MRRSSILRPQNSEPLIVIEDDNEREEEPVEPSRQNSEDETCMNPYLLSPFGREIRKHSLPTPQCSGITASQVRRLSERGETAGPGPKQVEFLSTLSSAPQPTGGRRHSVVTISRVPPTLMGRSRRESVAAFPASPYRGRVLPNRRESIACPPSTEPRGSLHNLQLDIMDDIVQARKVRMKMWNTSNEKVCEVQPLDDSGSVQRYTNSSTSRRFSDFMGTTLTPIPSTKKNKIAGIVCTNTDLISILSSRSSSATEIDQMDRNQDKNKLTAQRRNQLKSSRSNSFDISILEESKSNWSGKRYQATKTEEEIDTKDKKVIEKEPNKVVWDERSGSLVDPHALGSAIEVFLRKTSPSTDTPSTSNVSPTKSVKSGKGKNWFNKGEEDSSSETCDSSICSTLKDLFVK